MNHKEIAGIVHTAIAMNETITQSPILSDRLDVCISPNRGFAAIAEKLTELAIEFEMLHRETKWGERGDYDETLYRFIRGKLS